MWRGYSFLSCLPARLYCQCDMANFKFAKTFLGLKDVFFVWFLTMLPLTEVCGLFLLVFFVKWWLCDMRIGDLRRHISMEGFLFWFGASVICSCNDSRFFIWADNKLPVYIFVFFIVDVLKMSCFAFCYECD